MKAQRIVDILLEADEFDPEEIAHEAADTPKQPMVEVRLFDPEPKTYMLPVVVVMRMVLPGNSPGVGVVDRDHVLTGFEAEVIEYGANEGPPDMEGGTGGSWRRVEREADIDDDRTMEYRYHGAKEALDWVDQMEYEHADDPDFVWPDWVIDLDTYQNPNFYTR